MRFSLYCLLIFCMTSTVCFASNNFDLPGISEHQVYEDSTFKKLYNLKGKSTRSKDLSAEFKKLRPKAIEEVATRIGFQEGFLWRHKQIDAMLQSRQNVLDSIFNFSPLLLYDKTVMPPVITHADSFTDVKSSDEMIKVGVAYKILKPARVISVEPSWRDYLVLPIDAIKVDKLHAAMLPSDDDEQEVWQKALVENWFNGIEHADKVFQIGVNKLLVDMRGLIQYKTLEKQGYISVPMLSRGHYGIRVGNENLEFDQEIFRLTEKSKFTKKR